MTDKSHYHKQKVEASGRVINNQRLPGHATPDLKERRLKGLEGEKTLRLVTPAESPHYTDWLLEHIGVSRLEFQNHASPMNQQTKH